MASPLATPQGLTFVSIIISAPHPIPILSSANAQLINILSP